MTAFEAGFPCWVDATVPDLEAAKRFYGELFGWTYHDTGHGASVVALCDGKTVGALAADPEGASGAWNLYFASTDAAGAADRIGEAGGRVVAGPSVVPGMGTSLLATDPGGTVFGLWQADGHAGFDLHGAPGSFFWPEVYTRDKERVDPFYETVLGYQGQQVSEGTEFDFKLFSLPGGPQPVAARLQMGPYQPADLPAHMLVYFSVEDCDKAVETVRSLGGEVRREPMDSPFGRSALLSDDQGARFAVMGPVAEAG
ncbi:VOC family protein [Streptomyces verrucosisporus]|uniref:VOC family protein n=1 Tax=Streptomyces verrucosisporus TaxID=1695161 RepID=UPI0019D179EE|nr:VOC family protein [Streptomyces verrucosisporus]MBN3931856.1 VOC family protein [Streptomyces verrucosisporus]